MKKIVSCGERQFTLNLSKGTIVFVLVFVLTGCATTRQVQVIERVSRDTLYLSNVKYDSIYVYQGVEKDYRRDFHQPSTLNPQPLVDTIYIRDVQYEYKYKLLRDTVRVVQIDSIPVIREVEVVKTERYIPKVYKATFWICIILFCVFCAFCVLKIKRV